MSLAAAPRLQGTLCRSPFSSAARPVAPRRVSCAAGFGKSNKKVVDTSGGVYTTSSKRTSRVAEQLADSKGAKQTQAKQQVAKPDAAAGWIEVASTEIFAGKAAKPVILQTGKALMLFSHQGAVYCTDASSTAFQYPLTDAKIVDTPEGAVIEVPLDGTQYFLASGKVAKWCPKDSAVRKLLGTLKQVVDPIDLAVYPVITTDDGKIFTKFV